MKRKLNCRWFPLVLLVGLIAACGADPDADPDTRDATLSDTRDGDSEGDGSGSDTGEDTTPDDTNGDTADGSGEDGGDLPVDPPALLTLAEAMERVNPFVGSGGDGFGYASGSPAAQLPNGFIKVGPDTSTATMHVEQAHFSGYNYNDPDVRGFSHIRLIGTGAADLGNFRILPLREVDDTAPTLRYTRRDAEQELATPGYYSLALPDEGVVVELAPTNHAAIHRYRFEEDAWLQIEPTASITDRGVLAANASFEDSSLSGSLVFKGGFVGRERGFTLFYDLSFDPAPLELRAQHAETGEVMSTAEGSLEGTAFALLARFPQGATVTVRAGFSMISAERAAANRQEELGEKSLELIAQEAAAAWEPIFERVRIAGGTFREQRTFYSALYNAYRMPTLLSERDGAYMGMDEAVHQADPGGYYSDLSLWDTYRTLHPWYSLTNHDLQRACLQSLLRMGEQRERGVPRWPSMLGDTGSMIGTSADIVFGDAAVKGVSGIDWEYAFELLYRTAWGGTFDPPVPHGRAHIEDYATRGYIPYDEVNHAVSIALEYAWDDFGLAAVARAAGRDTIAEELEQRSLSFLNLLNPANGFFMPRDAEGEWVARIRPGTIYMGPGPFTEGNAWHWRFYGVWAPEVLDQALQEAGHDLGEQLEAFFERSRLGSPGTVATTLPDPYYWHGNEPALHAPALFHEAGLPQRASHWIREIQERLYNDTPDGLPGNDDGGTLSTWYLFTAMGLFPIAGSDLYVINAPLFDRVEIDLDDGTTFTVLAPGASVERRYWSQVTLNGEPLQGTTLRHAELSGATLFFRLTEDEP